MPSHWPNFITRCVSGHQIISDSTAVTVLNTTCARASLWPLRSPPNIPTSAVVALLPTLEPTAMAKPCIRLICPPANAAKVSSSVAWEDCSTTVSKKPTTKKISTSAMPPICVPLKSMSAPKA